MRFVWTLGLGLAACAAAFFGCSGTGDHTFGSGGSTDSGTESGPSGTGGSNVPPGSLSITPNPINAVVMGMDVSIPFKTVSSTDGDVTLNASYTLDDPSLGTVSAGAFDVPKTAMKGGKTILHALYGGKQTGQADVIVTAKGPDIDDPTAPMNPSTWFGNAGGTPPIWVYPFDRTMIPRNQPELKFQFNGVAGAGAYRIRFENQYYSRDVYLGPGACSGTQCKIQLTDIDWTSVAHAFAGQDVKLTLSASMGPNGPAGTAPAQTLSFSPEDVDGGLYYWSTTITGIYRVPLGSKSAQVFIDHGNATGCCGCHVVAQDGKKVALEFGSADNFQWGGGVVDGTNGMTYLLDPAKAIHWNLATFSPDGSKLIINWMEQAQVIDSTTGQTLFSVPDQMFGGKIAQPEWSPDGNSIVFVRYPNDGSGDEWNANNTGDIMIMPYNNGMFGVPQMIVQSTTNVEYHFYPSWTPDSKWIVFNTGTVPCNGFGSGCNNYDASNTRLRIVKAQQGAVPIDLTRATHMPGSTTNWPRVAPFIQNKGNLMFFTFSSKFPYGFEGMGGHPQLWMAAVDLSVIQNSPGTDPSYSPYWLTFQNVNESNHLATWTANVKCKMDSDCPVDNVCDNGNCIPNVPK